MVKEREGDTLYNFSDTLEQGTEFSTLLVLYLYKHSTLIIHIMNLWIPYTHSSWDFIET